MKSPIGWIMAPQAPDFATAQPRGRTCQERDEEPPGVLTSRAGSSQCQRRDRCRTSGHGNREPPAPATGCRCDTVARFALRCCLSPETEALMLRACTVTSDGVIIFRICCSSAADFRGSANRLGDPQHVCFAVAKPCRALADALARIVAVELGDPVGRSESGQAALLEADAAGGQLVHRRVDVVNLPDDLRGRAPRGAGGGEESPNSPLAPRVRR